MTETPAVRRVDVLVVGAGPAGLTAGLVLGRQQRQVLLVDDGLPRNEAAVHMHMYLSRDGDSPARLRELGSQEVARHAGVHRHAGRVESLAAAEGGGFEAVVSGLDAPVSARRVLLAYGVRDRLDDIPGVRQRWGTDVVHCAYCHGYETLGRRAVVVGHDPMAPLRAAYVADRFCDVTLCVGEPVPDEMRAAVDRADVTVVDGQVAAIDGAPGAPVVALADGRTLSADVVYHVPDFSPSSDLGDKLGCESTEEGLLLVAPTQETSVPGVFAAGDLGHQRGAPAPTPFVASAVADGQRAAVWIEQQLFLG